MNTQVIQFPEYHSVYNIDVQNDINSTLSNESIQPVVLSSPIKSYKIQFEDEDNLENFKEQLKQYQQQSLQISDSSYNTTHEKQYKNIQDEYSEKRPQINNKQTDKKLQKDLNELISQWLCTSQQDSKELIEELIFDLIMKTREKENISKEQQKQIRQQIKQLLSNSINIYNQAKQKQKLDKDQNSQQIIASMLSDDQTSTDLINQITNMIEQNRQKEKTQQNTTQKTKQLTIQDLLLYVYNFKFTDQKYQEFIKVLLDAETQQPDIILNNIIAESKTEVIGEIVKKTNDQLSKMTYQQVENLLIQTIQESVQKYELQYIDRVGHNSIDIDEMMNGIEQKSEVSLPEHNQLFAKYDIQRQNTDNINNLQAMQDNTSSQNVEYNSLIANVHTPENNEQINILQAPKEQQQKQEEFPDNLYVKKIQKAQSFPEANQLDVHISQQSTSEQPNVLNYMKRSTLSDINHDTINSFKQSTSDSQFIPYFLNADRSFKHDTVEIGYQQQMRHISKESTDISDQYNEIIDFYDRKQVKIENKSQNQQQQQSQQQQQQHISSVISEYPFYTTIYQVCGKCKQKHLQQNNNVQQVIQQNIQQEPNQIQENIEEQQEQHEQQEEIQDQPIIQIIKTPITYKEEQLPPKMNNQIQQIQSKVPITIQTISYQKPQPNPLYIQQTVFGAYQPETPLIDEQILVGKPNQQKIQQIQQQPEQEQPQEQEQQIDEIKIVNKQDDQVNQIIKVLFHDERVVQQEQTTSTDTPADEIIRQIIKQSMSTSGNQSSQIKQGSLIISQNKSLTDSEIVDKQASNLQNNKSSQSQSNKQSEQIQQSSQSIQQSSKSSKLQQSQKSDISNGQVYPQVNQKVLDNTYSQLSLSIGQVASQTDQTIEKIKQITTQLQQNSTTSSGQVKQ